MICLWKYVMNTFMKMYNLEIYEHCNSSTCIILQKTRFQQRTELPEVGLDENAHLTQDSARAVSSDKENQYQPREVHVTTKHDKPKKLIHQTEAGRVAAGAHRQRSSAGDTPSISQVWYWDTPCISRPITECCENWFNVKLPLYPATGTCVCCA